MALPLEGFRILSLAEQWPGPLATLLLADLGADIILVERPNGGDPSRRYDGHFSALNRNKRSVALDLKSADGRADFLRLVASADAVIEGFRPGTMARLGLAPEQLRAQRPELICASISAFGHTGPLRDVAGHDLSVQGMVGLLAAEPGREADLAVPFLPLGDIISGIFGALGLVTALLGRLRGRPVGDLDISMLDSLLAVVAPQILAPMNRQLPAPLPPQEPAYGMFASADGKQFTLSIAGEDHVWRELCAILDLRDVADLAEAERVAARLAIQPRLRAALARHDWDWLEEIFTARRITFGPVAGFADVARHAQIAARGMLFQVDEEHGGTSWQIRQPISFTGDVPQPRRRAPRLGEHTEEILRELAAGRAA